jgi:cell wall-associated NlpC family hydrolase
VPRNAKNNNIVTYWSSWCWLFVYDSWNLGAGQKPHYSGGTAQQTYNLYKSAGRMHAAGASPPRGSMVFFSYGTPGHVAISLGSGWVETTQGSQESQKLPVTHKTLSSMGMTQLGYVAPANVP